MADKLELEVVIKNMGDLENKFKSLGSSVAKAFTGKGSIGGGGKGGDMGKMATDLAGLGKTALKIVGIASVIGFVALAIKDLLEPILGAIELMLQILILPFAALLNSIIRPILGMLARVMVMFLKKGGGGMVGSLLELSSMLLVLFMKPIEILANILTAIIITPIQALVVLLGGILGRLVGFFAGDEIESKIYGATANVVGGLELTKVYVDSFFKGMEADIMNTGATASNMFGSLLSGAGGGLLEGIAGMFSPELQSKISSTMEAINGVKKELDEILSANGLLGLSAVMSQFSLELQKAINSGQTFNVGELFAKSVGEVKVQLEQGSTALQIMSNNSFIALQDFQLKGTSQLSDFNKKGVGLLQNFSISGQSFISGFVSGALKELAKLKSQASAPKKEGSLIDTALDTYGAIGGIGGALLSTFRGSQASASKGVMSAGTKVQDLILTPDGRAFQTDKADTIIATKNPGGMGGGANITVNINNAQVRSDADIREIARAVSRELEMALKRGGNYAST